MTMIRSTGDRMGLFKCGYCEEEIEVRSDAGQKAHTCGKIDCTRKHRVEKNWVKYPETVMEVVEDLGFVDDSHRVKYQCPHCDATPILTIGIGYTQSSCGKPACKSKVAIQMRKTGITAEFRIESIRELKKTWSNMNRRCYEPTSTSYDTYGAKGIVVEWTTFEDFYASIGDSYITERIKYLELESSDLGDALSIERIDPDGNYCEGNCEWIPQRVNATRRHDEVNPVVQLDMKMRLIKTWTSARDAAREISNIKQVFHIKEVCDGTRNECMGFVWRWEEDYCKVEEHPLWEKVVSEGCSKAWRNLDKFESDIGIIPEGKKVIRDNGNKDWSISNIRIVDAGYERTDRNTGAVEQIDLETGDVVATFESVKKAKIATGINNIGPVLKGRRKKAGGYFWKYVE